MFDDRRVTYSLFVSRNGFWKLWTALEDESV